MPGGLQGSLNIIPRQFRVATQQGIPRFIVGQLFQHGGHRNPCAFDNWLAARHARIDFNALAHARSILALREHPKLLDFAQFSKTKCAPGWPSDSPVLEDETEARTFVRCAI